MGFVFLPPNKKSIGCKWVYRIKENSDAPLTKFKAFLVAQGFHQVQGFYFNETFPPVVKPIIIRLMLNLALSYKWPLKQLVVNNAFLNRLLEEEVYIALYGLK